MGNFLSGLLDNNNGGDDRNRNECAAPRNYYHVETSARSSSQSAFTSGGSSTVCEAQKVPSKSKLAEPKIAQVPCKNVTSQERWIKHYSSSQKILIVGDGDFSFSACLARAFGTAHNMHATSLDSIDFLVKNYKKSLQNIYELKRRGCTVIHGVDATEMASHSILRDHKFDRIIFNFPLAGFFWEESRQSQISRNQNLVLGFFKNAKKVLKSGGEVHVSHKSMGFYLQWNINTLAQISGLEPKEEVAFDLRDYPGYENKYGYGGDKNFDCNPSKTYKFKLPKLIGVQYF